MRRPLDAREVGAYTEFVRDLAAFLFLFSAALAPAAHGQVKADLGVSPSAGIGASGGVVAVPMSPAALAPSLVASPLTLSAPAPVLSAVAAVPAAPAALAAPAPPLALALPAAAAPVEMAPLKSAPAASGIEIKPRSSPAAGTAGASIDAAVDWTSGARLFDNFLGEGDASAAPAPAVAAVKAAPLSAWSARAARSPQAEAYASAVNKASAAGWSGRAGPVLDAAETLLTAQGVKFERAPDSLRIAAERGVSPLNDLAFDVRRTLGADVAYVPERTRDAAAAFNGKQKLLMVANFDRPDFFIAAIHEARHAWYSALLRRGDIRLFHLQAVARPGRSVAPGAEVYARYLSLEEVSNFPKTLKHMLTEQSKLKGDAAKYLADRTTTRARQFVDILRSSAYIAAQIEGLDRKGLLKPRRMTPAEVAATDLEPSEAVDYFALELSNQTLYVPVLKRETRRFGLKVVRGSVDEARAALRRRAKLLGGLVESAAPAAGGYLAAARAGDLAAAGAAADRLIAEVRKAEGEWPAEVQ